MLDGLVNNFSDKYKNEKESKRIKEYKYKQTHLSKLFGYFFQVPKVWEFQQR